MGTTNNEAVADLAQKVKGLDAPAVIREAARYFGAGHIALASSLSAEDQVLTHMIRSDSPGVGIFTIDTGRLPQETYDTIQATMEKYKFHYDVLFPDAKKVNELVGTYGPNLFYDSVDLRKKCCEIRKVLPLRKKLGTLKAWLCGLRREQAVTRSDVEIVEWDAANAIVKINPIAGWTHDEVLRYIKENKIPYNKLHDEGYPSIGCAPCTRAVKPGEDIRAGRWWWESPEHKECGLHNHKKMR